jgi:FkbM family methyltransferase
MAEWRRQSAFVAVVLACILVADQFLCAVYPVRPATLNGSTGTSSEPVQSFLLLSEEVTRRSDRSLKRHDRKRHQDHANQLNPDRPRFESASDQEALRSSFPANAPPSQDMCSVMDSTQRATTFRQEFARLGSTPSACASGSWMTALRDADFRAAEPGSNPRRRIVINVGANKGYVVATALGLWLPSSGASPTDLFEYLRDKPISTERNRCGMCDDCKSVLAQPPTTPSGASSLVSAVAYAIEPQPSNFRLLRGYADILRSRLAADVLLPFQMGLAASDSNGTFEERGMGDEGSSLGNINRGSGPLVTVPVMSVDSFVRAYVDPSQTRIVDIIYMDTEGYDPAVLAGATATLPFTRIVVFEYNSLALWESTSLETTVAVLDSIYGFDCYLEWREGLIRLSGGCWDPVYELRAWSNVLCVNRRDMRWSQAVARMAASLGPKTGR